MIRIDVHRNMIDRLKTSIEFPIAAHQITLLLVLGAIVIFGHPKRIQFNFTMFTFHIEVITHLFVHTFIGIRSSVGDSNVLIFSFSSIVGIWIVRSENWLLKIVL